MRRFIAPALATVVVAFIATGCCPLSFLCDACSAVNSVSVAPAALSVISGADRAKLPAMEAAPKLAEIPLAAPAQQRF